MSFIIRIIFNAIAIFAAARFVEGIAFKGDVLDFLLAGLILALINLILRPILKLLATPLIALTLGLFTIIINMGLLWVADYFIEKLAIEGFWPLFWGTIIISIVNLFASAITKR